MTRLLLVHTGGTIGMVRGAKGFEPRDGIVETLSREIVTQELPGLDLDIHPIDPLTDSADVTPDHWNRLVDLIVAAHQSHDGVVVTHGTDTLAYTAAALCFALNGLALPVVLTGAMRPPACEDSDARDNLRDALHAATTGVPGVRVQFAGRSMLGDRVVKVSSIALDAFREVPALCHPAPMHQREPLAAKSFAEARIAILTLSPGMTAEALGAAISPLDGVVLRCFGSGTFPSNPRLQDVLSSAIRRGLRILAISQCEHGGLRPEEYAAGATLCEAGIINGAALTAEAAFAKLALAVSENSDQRLQ